MDKNIVKILETSYLTHDVIKIVTEKPDDVSFTPGQATEIAINKNGWENEGRPFTFTNLPDEDSLQFTIKIYPSHNGVTNELKDIKNGDELILKDIFGAIAYSGEGVFIAGGAGVTPFISIFRHLKKENKIGNNKLIFANKSKKDIILEEEFRSYLGDAFINILEQGDEDNYEHGRISEDFLNKHISDFNNKFYICGPPPMMDAVLEQLSNLGVSKNSIITEKF